jgi:hypothetical protein
MSDKTWGKTVLGWFVVQEDQQGAPEGGANADYVPFADAATGESSEAPLEVTPVEPAAPAVPYTPAESGKVDFAAVFETAGVDAEEQSRVDRAGELLRNLPANTDAAVKKQIVHASLTAFGVPVEKIIETGVEEIQALEGYIRSGATDTQKVVEESERRIKLYEEQIAQLKTIMQQRVEEQQNVIRSCNDKKLEIQQILEFFGRDAVERVVKASPKLVDPSEGQ